MRAECYPIETIYGFENVPTDQSLQDENGKPLPMLIIDEVSRKARWREKLTPGMQGGVARLIYAEMDHDGF